MTKSHKAEILASVGVIALAIVMLTGAWEVVALIYKFLIK